MKNYTGGIIDENLLQKLLKVDEYRRWVICPNCKNIFETYQKNNCFCGNCRFEGECETVIQTIML
jgi:rRNA maturation endonuclease Nob1